MTSRKAIYAVALSAGLFTAGSAVHFGSAWHKAALLAQGKAEQSQLALEQQNNALHEASSLGEDDTPAPNNRDQAIAATLLGLKAAAVSHGVKHTQVTVSGSPTSSQDTSVESLFQALPNAGGRIAAATLMVKGQYKDYPSFQRYLDAIVKLPGSARRLAVNDNAFELDIRVYAVNPTE